MGSRLSTPQSISIQLSSQWYLGKKRQMCPRPSTNSCSRLFCSIKSGWNLSMRVAQQLDRGGSGSPVKPRDFYRYICPYKKCQHEGKTYTRRYHLMPWSRVGVDRRTRKIPHLDESRVNKESAKLVFFQNIFAAYQSFWIFFLPEFPDTSYLKSQRLKICLKIGQIPKNEGALISFSWSSLCL